MKKRLNQRKIPLRQSLKSALEERDSKSQVSETGNQPIGAEQPSTSQKPVPKASASTGSSSFPFRGTFGTSRLRSLFRRGGYDLPPVIQTKRADLPGWEHKFSDWKDVHAETELLKIHKDYLKDHGFTLTKLIGEGGYGKVYQVTQDLGNGQTKEMAFKIQSLGRFKFTDVVDAVEMHTKESKMYSELDHPNIVKREEIIHIYDYKSQFPKPVHILILMELMEGDLADLYNQTGGLSEMVANNWFRQIIRGLHYMHENGFSHLDIKPQNILYSTYVTDGRNHYIFKLTDFGVTHKSRGRDELVSGSKGTSGYMAPEVEGGRFGVRWAAKPADIYALGVTLSLTLGYDLDNMEIISQDGSSGRDTVAEYGVSGQVAVLIGNMTLTNPRDRLTTEELLHHEWVCNAFPENEDMHTKL